MKKRVTTKMLWPILMAPLCFSNVLANTEVALEAPKQEVEFQVAQNNNQLITDKKLLTLIEEDKRTAEEILNDDASIGSVKIPTSLDSEAVKNFLNEDKDKLATTTSVNLSTGVQVVESIATEASEQEDTQTKTSETLVIGAEKIIDSIREELTDSEKENIPQISLSEEQLIAAFNNVADSSDRIKNGTIILTKEQIKEALGDDFNFDSITDAKDGVLYFSKEAIKESFPELNYNRSLNLGLEIADLALEEEEEIEEAPSLDEIGEVEVIEEITTEVTEKKEDVTCKTTIEETTPEANIPAKDDLVALLDKMYEVNNKMLEQMTMMMQLLISSNLSFKNTTPYPMIDSYADNSIRIPAHLRNEVHGLNLSSLQNTIDPTRAQVINNYYAPVYGGSPTGLRSPIAPQMFLPQTAPQQQTQLNAPFAFDFRSNDNYVGASMNAQNNNEFMEIVHNNHLAQTQRAQQAIAAQNTASSSSTSSENMITN